MRTGRAGTVAFLLLLFVLALAPPATASRDAGIAALQVGLRARSLYVGSIDGVKGPDTSRAIRRFQRRAGIAVDGIPGPATRRALGCYGRHLLGSRPLIRGAVGWDVAALQFLLAWHGFPSATFDGGLGMHTERALRGFQRWAGLHPDGIAGASTLAALRRPPSSCPIALAWPLQAPVGDRFSPRGNRFHAGIDLLADTGTPVAAAASGRVVFTGITPGWGNLVVVAHAQGVETMYAHLATITVHENDLVSAGTLLATVGATGNASGPHLHLEVRVRGAAVDPRSALP
jgi:peptidoglycan hydrolase-like protein with peptidoglycan-binding domain